MTPLFAASDGATNVIFSLDQEKYRRHPVPLLEIDNRAVGRALRAVVVGRKKLPLRGICCGGQRAATMYSVIGSAKLNGVDPELYLSTARRRSLNIPCSNNHQLLP